MEMDAPLLNFVLQRNTKPPPFLRLPAKDYIKCLKLIKQNNQALKVLSSSMNENSSLWTEIEILRKAVYKLKCVWRLEPLFKGTKQVMKCMTRLKEQKIFDIITSALESVLGLDGKTLVPSKQYLQFILIKMIGVGQLARQTIDYCVYVQTKIMDKMKIGHVLNNLMAFTAFNSRVWVLCHTLLVQISKSYNSVYSLCELSTAADYTWLPDNISLPQTFPIDVTSLISSSIFEDETSSCQDPLINPAARDGAHTHSVSSKLGTQPEVQTSQSEDVGVIISRDSFRTMVASTESENSTIKDSKTPGKKHKRKSDTTGPAKIPAKKTKTVATPQSVQKIHQPAASVQAGSKRRKKEKEASKVQRDNLTTSKVHKGQPGQSVGKKKHKKGKGKKTNKQTANG